MTPQTKSLFAKEWIKLRRAVWLLPLIVAYAAGDALLILQTIERNHDAFGLWVTLVIKTPPFVARFALLPLCGMIVGFFQAWPECKDKRLRILFHTPVPPALAISVMLATGTGMLLAANLAAMAALAGAMALFHLPWDIMAPVLSTVAPWSMLCFATYFTTVAFLAARPLPLKLLVLTCCYGASCLLGSSPMYGFFAQSLPQHALFTAACIPLVYFVFLRFQGDPADKPLFRVARLAGLALASLCLLGTLPTLYWRTVMPEHPRGTLFYSPVMEQFVMSGLREAPSDKSLGGLESVYSREDGTELDEREYFRSLPFLYAANLQKWGIFPERIQGRRIPAQLARSSWRYERFRPADHNTPAPMLHMLLDAEPEGADLKYPDDMFRVRADGGGLEFLHPETGGVDEEKSARFTGALRQKGFEFPVTALGGNPETRKEYDAGYFLVDSANSLFQLQMVKGRPHCVNSGFSIPGRVRGVLVKESRDKEFCAFIPTDTTLYAVKLENLAVRPLPIPGYDADDTSLVFFADLLNTSTISSSITDHKSGQAGIAMNKGLHPIHTFTKPADEKFVRAMDTRMAVESFLFPLTLDQRQPGSRFIGLSINGPHVYWAAACGSLLALVAYVSARRRTGRSVRFEDCALMLAFGPAALLAVLTADARSLFGLSSNTL